ncbi:MAG: hypothetical protein JOZ41_03010 [Chloroflexi bacterium]|nr:hypothetical protein [Chloroflexota bacterium]
MRSFSTKQGNQMGSFQLTGLRSSLEVLVFSRSYEQLQPRMVENAIALVEGKFDAQEGRVRLLADGIYSLDEASERPKLDEGKAASNGNGNGKPAANGDGADNGSASVVPAWKLVIEIQRGADRSRDIAQILRLYETLQRYRGQDEVELVVRRGSRAQSVPLPNGRIGFCDQLRAELERMLGQDGWRVQRLGAA